MSKPSEQVSKEEQKPVADFILAKVGGRFRRFATREDLPADVEEGPYDLNIVRSMTKEQVSDLYGAVAHVQAKHFKEKSMAIESLAYQVGKMPVFDPNAPKVEPSKQGTTAKTAKTTTAPKAKKTDDTFELLAPADMSKALGSLAPQARELVSIMTDLAKEKGEMSFSGSELDKKINEPEVAARLKTKQEPSRILAYYKAKLISQGLIRVS